MKRKLLDQLLAWKNAPQRKPVLLDGARQTGKSYLLEKILGEHFAQVVRIDFLEQPSMAELFKDSLNPDDILANLELVLNIKIDVANALIIFDEIGECQAAVNSLKFFAEQKPQIYLCASGSNIGLLASFPVGKVEFLELHPLSYEEFLWAANQPALVAAFNEMALSKVVHQKLFSLLLDYYFVGGMPEVVNTWFAMPGSDHDSLVERIERVSQLQKTLLAGYELDFGKYAGKVSANQISAVFNTVPKQLAQFVDDSVKRFKFKEAAQNVNRYQQLAGPIDWLVKCKLLSKCHPIEGRPTLPLQVLAKENLFKLFFFDVGLLGSKLGISYQQQRDQGLVYKGYIAENFVQNELRLQQSEPTYSWEYARSEVEFLYRTANGQIIPVEVKSGKRTRAKSLGVYVDRYMPSQSVKLVGTTGSLDDPTAIVLPLYYASKLGKVTCTI
ncbi:AAA family ATPase [Porticoccaceae bacterium]|nr:AAA family ATPase [Porticoccaceae bacterium]